MPRARPGSTTYDGADPEAPEPAWQGASWYGESSGTYWRINPKEYADPRKHGPEYQARSRRVAADMAATAAAPAATAAAAAAAGAPSASARPAAPAGDPGRATSASGGPVGATQAGPAGRDAAAAGSGPAGHDAAGHDAAGHGPASAGGHPAEKGRYPRHGWRSWLRLPFRRRVR